MVDDEFHKISMGNSQYSDFYIKTMGKKLAYIGGKIFSVCIFAWGWDYMS